MQLYIYRWHRAASSPARDDLAGEFAPGRAEEARESKIGELDQPAGGEQQVARFQVAVQHPVGVAKGEAAQGTDQVALDA